MMSMNFAENIAQAMTEIHRGWQVPGCRRMLMDYAHEAQAVPLAEIGAAALLFAQNPAVQVPSIELFRSGPHWRNSLEHERTLRPADRPRCTFHAPEPLPCRWCESERKADANPAAPVVMVTEEQAATNAVWAQRVKDELAVAQRAPGGNEEENRG